jgi:hypothetical protein
VPTYCEKTDTSAPENFDAAQRKVHEMTARLIERRHMDAAEFKRLMEAPD